MAESAQDLIGVFLGLVALWFLFGGLIKEERGWQIPNAQEPFVEGSPARDRMMGG